MQLSQSAMLISRLLFVSLVAVGGLNCKSDLIDERNVRTRLTGDLKVAVVATYRNTDGVLDMEFRGRVTFPVDVGDSRYDIPGKGSFRRRIILRDTLSAQRETTTIYYTLPGGYAVKIDSSLTTLVCLFKQTANGFGLILKTKSDSLVCFVSNLSGDDLEAFQSQTGVENFRVRSGSDAYFTRNTECGREGDHDTWFSVNAGFLSVQPARGTTLRSGTRVYSVVNIVNTQILKKLEVCPDYKGEFACMAIKQ